MAQASAAERRPRMRRPLPPFAAALASALALASLERGPLTAQAVPTDLCARPSCSGVHSSTEFLAEHLVAAGYDRSLRPPCSSSFEQDPTVVEVQFRLTQVNTIDQKLGQLIFNGYFRTWWTDPRLRFNDTSNGGCFDKIILEPQANSLIWTPDLYFPNLIKKKVDGPHASLLQVSANGDVWSSEQVLLTVKSPMNFGRIPFDEHIAKIVVSSLNYDIEEMRLIPRGGKVGPGSSGVGVKAGPVKSIAWEFHSGEADNEDAEEEGFETQGLVKVTDDVDQLTLMFEYSRKPGYFLLHVVWPSILFLLVSYIAFFVDPKAAPARAALAVIPVLIMRTMGNAVNSSFPQGSQQMWLEDFVTAAFALCVLASMQFAVVMYFMQRQKRRASSHAALKKVKEAVEHTWEQAEKEQITLWDMLQRYRPEEVDPKDVTMQKADSDNEMDVGRKSELSQVAHGRSQHGGLHTLGVKRKPRPDQVIPIDADQEIPKMKKASAIAKQHNVKESDLSVLRYVHEVFTNFDEDGSGTLAAKEVREAFTFFNIYKSTETTASIMCMFQRDRGMFSPQDQMEAKIRFSTFTLLLISIDEYTLAYKPVKNPRHWLRAYLQALSPVETLDTLSRFFFPVMIFIGVCWFFATVPLYGTHD